MLSPTSHYVDNHAKLTSILTRSVVQAVLDLQNFELERFALTFMN